jgi:hypothetical protein
MATTADLIALMTAVEAQKPLKYTRTGFFDQPLAKQTNSFTKIAGFGISRFGKMIVGDFFLLSDPDLEIKIEPIPQKLGGIKYYISTRLNPKTVRLAPGGAYRGDTVISGELMKYSLEPEAKETFAIFQREMKRQFCKHASYPYWLGKEAAAMHAVGGRLTNDVKGHFSLPREEST